MVIELGISSEDEFAEVKPVKAKSLLKLKNRQASRNFRNVPSVDQECHKRAATPSDYSEEHSHLENICEHENGQDRNICLSEPVAVPEIRSVNSCLTELKQNIQVQTDNIRLLEHIQIQIRTEKIWIDRESQTDDILAEPSLVERICQDQQTQVENWVNNETQSDNFLAHKLNQTEDIFGQTETPSIAIATQTEIALRDEHSQTEYTDKYAAKRQEIIQSRKRRFSSLSQPTEDNHLLVNALPGLINRPVRVLFDKDLRILRYCINAESRGQGVYLSPDLTRRTQNIVTTKMLNELTEKVEIYSGVYLREVELFNENEKLIVGKLTIAAKTILPFEYSKLSCDQGTTILCLLKGTAILKSSVQKPGQDILERNVFLPKHALMIQSGAFHSIENCSCTKAHLFYCIQCNMEKLDGQSSSI